MQTIILRDLIKRYFAPLLTVVLVLLAWCSHLYAEEQYLPDPQNKKNIVRVKPEKESRHLVFKGNIRVSDAVLRRQVPFRDDHPLKITTVKGIAKKVREFYHRLGYKLASTHPVCGKRLCSIFIDEGSIDNIFIFGLGWSDTLALRNSILPGNIYNQVQLNQDLSVWEGRKGIEKVTYELKRKEADNKRILGSILKPLSQRQSENEAVIVRSRRASYDIYIYFTRNKELSRSSIGLKAATLDGLSINSKLSTHAGIFTGDRFNFRGEAGYTRRSSIDPNEDINLSFFNTSAQVSYSIAPTRIKWLEFGLFSDTDFRFEQRADLPINRYLYVQSENVFETLFRLYPYSYIGIFAGYDFRQIFEERLVPSDPFVITTDRAESPITGLELKLLFGRAQPDRRLNDFLDVRFKTNIPGYDREFGELKGTFQTVVRHNAFDLIFKTEGVTLFKDASFFDEHFIRRIGNHSSFDRRIFVRDAATQTVEFRYNLIGKNCQIGVFDDVTVFNDINRQTGFEEIALANAAGPVVLFLIENILQLQFRYSFGASSTGITGHDFLIYLDKVY